VQLDVHLQVVPQVRLERIPRVAVAVAVATNLAQPTIPEQAVKVEVVSLCFVSSFHPQLFLHPSQPMSLTKHPQQSRRHQISLGKLRSLQMEREFLAAYLCRLI
jgi:hypothetical protein